MDIFKVNEDVLRAANSQRELITLIRRRQSSFFGHVMNMGKLECVVTMGSLEGKRGRGRTNEMMLNSFYIMA